MTRSETALDSIIQTVLATLSDGDGYLIDPSLGILGSVAAAVQRACRKAGVRVPHREVFERVSDFAFGDGNEDEARVQ